MENCDYSGRQRQCKTQDLTLKPGTVSILVRFFEVPGIVISSFKLRGRLSADFRKGGVSGGVAVNYVGAFHDLTGVRVDDHATVDLQLRLKAPKGRFEGTGLNLYVRNAFDKDPPFYNNPFGFPFDPANADIIGRFVKVQLTRSW